MAVVGKKQSESGKQPNFQTSCPFCRFFSIRPRHKKKHLRVDLSAFDTNSTFQFVDGQGIVQNYLAKFRMLSRNFSLHCLRQDPIVPEVDDNKWRIFRVVGGFLTLSTGNF